jgi:UDP-glucose 4-epimerase
VSHGHLIKNIAIQSLKKKPIINIFGNDYPTKYGTCVRDYIHVLDLADVHIKGLDYLKNKKKSFLLNCGYGKGYSVQEIVTIFKKLQKILPLNIKKEGLVILPKFTLIPKN